MKIIYPISFLLILAFFQGCSSQSTLIKPVSNLKDLSDNVQVEVIGRDIDSRILDQLTRETKAQLLVSGFNIDKTNSKSIKLKIDVSDFSPGNTALRIAISFGAGRGSLLYHAEYTNQEGNILAEMNGEERFTGLEVGFNNNYGAFTSLGGEETATTVLIKEAAKHIVELALKSDRN